MIENLRPNNNKSLILVARIVIFIVFLLLIVASYSNYKAYIDIEWLPEFLFLSILLITSWFYCVSMEWNVELEGRRINIQLAYNLVLYGKIIIKFSDGEEILKRKFSSNTDVPLVINSNRYVASFKRNIDENFFRCSIIRIMPVLEPSLL